MTLFKFRVRNGQDGRLWTQLRELYRNTLLSKVPSLRLAVRQFPAG